VEGLGYKIPTSALMHILFIPFVIELFEKGDIEAKSILQELGRGEWLDDVIINKEKLKIGNMETVINLPKKQHGKFKITDLNEFGYPNKVRYTKLPFIISNTSPHKDKDNIRKYFYSIPTSNENVVFRGWCLGWDLRCDHHLTMSCVTIGVRLAKFI